MSILNTEQDNSRVEYFTSCGTQHQETRVALSKIGVALLKHLHKYNDILNIAAPTPSPADGPNKEDL